MTSSEEPRPRTGTAPGSFGFFASLERFLLLAVLSATAVTVLLAARNGLDAAQRPFSFALVFGLWFAVLYVVVATGSSVVAVALARLFRRPVLSRVLLGLAALCVLGTLALANVRPIQQLFAMQAPSPLRCVNPLLFLASVGGIVAVAALPRRRSGIARLVGILVVAAFVVASWPARPSSASPSTEDLSQPRTSVHLSGQRLLLFGLDGADWTFLEALMKRGELPNLRALRERGIWGPLSTIRPAESPVIWTTIATGHTPEAHGIRRFTTRRIRGVSNPLPRLRPIHGLGYGLLTRALIRSGQLFDSPVSSISRKVPAFWNLATAEKVPVTVLNWWATWPAEPILGDLVTERLNYWRFAARGWPPESARLTYPPSLQGEISPLMMDPAQVTAEQARVFMDVTPEEFAAYQAEPFRKHTIRTELPHLYAMFETNRRVALHLVERGRRQWSRPADMLLIVTVVDHACHAALQYSELVDDHIQATPEEQRKFGRVVTEAYRQADALLGELMKAFGPSNVLVVSDHGFHLESYWPNWEQAYAHEFAPDGVIIAAGPAFGQGRVEGLSVYEVFPIMAYLKGLPLAKDLPGRLPLEVFTEDFRATHPVRHVASYGKRDSGAAAGEVPSGVDSEMLDHLKALGYLE